ncbi:MAG: hypothetical protein ACP5IX_03425 [Patescibacteria group bacterium]
MSNREIKNPLIILGVLLALIGVGFVWKKLFAPMSTITPSTISPKTETKKETATEEQREFKFSWQEDKGVRASDGSVPFALKLNDGKIRLYYCGPAGIISAISSDGLNFQKESGVRIAPLGRPGDPESMVCDATVVNLPDGQIRMYYKGATGMGGPGQSVHRIYSAISSDGLNFKKEGLRIDSQKTGDNGWASVPEAVKLPDGRVRIYYVSADPEAKGGIMSAISSDGLNFQKETGVRLKGNFVDPAVIILADGTFWLTAVYNCVPEKENCSQKNGFYGFFSKDGLNFTGGQLIYPAFGVDLDPSIIKISENTYRIYYGELGGPGVQAVKSITVKVSSY